MEPGAQCTVHSLPAQKYSRLYMCLCRGQCPESFPRWPGRAGPFGSRELFSLIARHQRGIGPPWAGCQEPGLPQSNVLLFGSRTPSGPDYLTWFPLICKTLAKHPRPSPEYLTLCNSSAEGALGALATRDGAGRGRGVAGTPCLAP